MLGRVKDLAKSLLPKRLYAAVRRTLLYGGFKYLCPICGGRFRKFQPYPYDVTIHDGTCPKCFSLMRSRLLWLYLRERTDFFKSRLKVLKVLHVAPERALHDRFRSLPNLEYLSADIESPLAMAKMDITHIPMPDGSFDVVLCNHVLEHIIDDAKAMRELYRVLKKGGWAVLQVPVLRESTYEDFAIVDPEARLQAFGQRDHVRVYGRDYADRLRAAGFAVTEDRYVKTLSPDVVARCQLDPTETVYFCRK